MRIAVYPDNSSLNGRPVFAALIEHLKAKGEKVFINEDLD